MTARPSPLRTIGRIDAVGDFGDNLDLDPEAGIRRF
jgi:hypothetical protein